MTEGKQSRPSRPWTPAEAWAKLVRGNERFVAGEHWHPNQDAARRDSLTEGQTPIAVFFGCADSRVAAEIIFDRGLGDLFVVRTAGHVIDPGVLGSIEFGVAVLDIPLVVDPRARLVRRGLRHSGRGGDRRAARGYIRDIVERVTPSVLAARQAGMTTAEEIEAEHVRHTLRLLTERSRLIADRIASGRLAVVGAAYDLGDGRARIVDSVGLGLNS